MYLFLSADFPYNKSASLPGYGRNGIYKVSCSDHDIKNAESRLTPLTNSDWLFS